MLAIGLHPLLSHNACPRARFTRIMRPPPPHFQSYSKAYDNNNNNNNNNNNILFCDSVISPTSVKLKLKNQKQKFSDLHQVFKHKVKADLLLY